MLLENDATLQQRNVVVIVAQSLKSENCVSAVNYICLMTLGLLTEEEKKI